MKLNRDVDNALIEAMKHGDKRAMQTCYSILAPSLFTALIKVVGCKSTAEDLLQDSFIQIFQSVQGYQNWGSFSAWCKKIALNRCFNYLRREKRMNNSDLLVLDYQIAEENFELDLAQEQLFDNLLNKLTPDARLVVWMFVVEGYTHQEIAELTGKSLSYSKSILSRAIAGLSKSGIAKHAAP